MATMNRDAIVVAGTDPGIHVIPVPTPLTRLNYFDGKFLRADDLRTEQDYLRRLTWISNQGLGSGVVFGYDTTLGGGDGLVLGPGLAIDGRGRVLLLPHAHTVGLQALIDASSRTRSNGSTPATVAAGDVPFSDCEVVTESPGGDVATAGNLWIITIGFAEALCGEEDVFGRLCEEACATSTDRPLRLEGIVVRAVPLRLETALATSGAVALDSRHFRSLVASAFFADEWRRGQSLISGEGLRSEAWCLGSHPDLGGDVPVAVVLRTGNTTGWLDPWIARRERIEAPARRYWAGRMAMRPWDAYLAQILQFQCQLHELLGAQPEPGVAPDPCAPNRAVLREAASALDTFESAGLVARLDLPTVDISREALTARPTTLSALAFTPDRFAALKSRIRSTLAETPSENGQTRVLIRGGIVELPPAGYLPVVPGTVPVNLQVRRLLGEGLDYRFCVVRHDFPAHALETVQHMERISLLQGLDHPDQKQRVDILVPDGQMEQRAAPPQGIGFDTRIALRFPFVFGDRSRTGLIIHGAGRADTPSSGGALFAFAGSSEVATTPSPSTNAVFTAPSVMRSAAFVRTVGVETIGTVDTGGSAANVDQPAAATTAAGDQPAAAAATPDQRSDFWASLHIDRNVLTMGPGETTTLRVFADAAIPSGDGESGIETQTFGQFRVATAEEVSGGGRRVTGTVTLVANRQTHTAGGETSSSNGHTLLDVEIVTNPAGTTPAGIVIRLRQHGVFTRVPTTFVVRGAWHGDPLEAEFTFGTESAAGTITFADAAAASVTAIAAALLRENPDVLVRGNPVNQLALDALSEIGAAIADDTFADTAGKELFPPPPPQTDEATVTATLDWVLFHRRREKQCGPVAPAPPPPAKLTSHLVFRIDPRQADRVSGELRNGQLMDVLTFNDPPLVQPIGRADFREGSPDLASSPAGLVQNWSAAGGGTPQQAFVVTKQDDPDAAETALGPARAHAVVAALGGPATAEVTPLQAGELPPNAEAVTLILPATLCHHVFGVPMRTASNQFGQLLQDNDIVAFLNTGVATDLGELDFDPGTANVSSGSSLSTTLPAAGIGTQLEGLLTFTRPGDPATTEPLENQARVAAAQAGATLPTAVTFVPPPPHWEQRVGATGVGWPTCPFVTLVLVPGTPQ